MYLLVDANTYSEVYMFSHRYAGFSGSFVAIQTASGEELMLTADHYLYINGKLAVASTVKIGDTVSKGDGTVPSLCRSQLKQPPVFTIPTR